MRYSERKVTVRPREYDKADIILHGGKVLTAGHNEGIEQAVAIRGELLQAVGRDQDVDLWRPSSKRPPKVEPRAGQSNDMRTFLDTPRRAARQSNRIPNASSARPLQITGLCGQLSKPVISSAACKAMTATMKITPREPSSSGLASRCRR